MNIQCFVPYTILPLSVFTRFDKITPCIQILFLNDNLIKQAGGKKSRQKLLWLKKKKKGQESEY